MTATDTTTASPPVDALRALIGRGTLYGIGTALQFSVTIAVLPAFARLLPADEYGVIAVALLVQLALALLTPIERFLPAHEPERAAPALERFAR